MQKVSWQWYAAASAAVIAAGLPFGEAGLGIAFALVCCWSVAAIVIGTRRHRPAHAEVWYLFAVALGLFLVGAVAGELAPVSAETGLLPYPGWREPFDLAGYVAILGSLWIMGLTRQVHRDRTITLDALITVFGIGSLAWMAIMREYVVAPELSSLGKIVGVAFSLLALSMGLGTIRLAIGPGARSRAYYLLAGAAVGGFVTEVLIEVELVGRSPFDGSGTLSTFASVVSFVFVGSAALHPSMVEMTEAPADPIPIVTGRRLALMGCAVLVAPALLLISASRGSRWSELVLVVVWASMSIMVVVRIASLALARERAAGLDRVVSSVGSGFATAPDADSMVARLLGSLDQVVPGMTGASFHVWKHDHWSVEQQVGQAVSRVADDRPAPDAGHRSEQFGDQWQMDIHINVAGKEPALVSVAARARPPAMYLERVAALVTDLSQAVEAAQLRELVSRDRFERRFRVLVQNSADVVFVIDAAGVTRFVTSAGPRLLGLTERELLAAPFSSLVIGEMGDNLDLLLAGELDVSTEIQLVGATGEPLWFEASSADMLDEPEVAGIVVTAREITARKQAELDRRRSELRFAALVKYSSDLVAVIGDDRAVSWASPSVSEILGFDRSDLVGSDVSRLVHPADRDEFDRRLAAGAPEQGRARSFELRLTNVGNEWLTLECTLTDLRDEPSVAGVVLNAHDITERKWLEDTLRHQLDHDDLTGVPNRVLFRRRIKQTLTEAAAPVVAVMVLDLDDFKTVNDGLGHSVGDEVLKVTASRLQESIRSGEDVVARLGGDEFALLLSGDRRSTVMAICERLLGWIQEPIEIEGRVIRAAASAGVAFADDLDYPNPEAMLRNADVAMYGAKSRGKGRITVFDQSMHENAVERLELKGDLLGAEERGELELHYQPFVDLVSGAVTGFEALMRWNHPERGMVSPATFIPLAEETGLIVSMGRWLLRTALAQLKEWQQLGPETSALSMSVNISGRQLEDARIVEDIAEAIESAGVDPATVVCELTESIAVEEAPALVAKLREIRASGVGLHADDFGAGFASYSALQALPFSGVKIDRSLVAGLDGSAPVRAEVQIRSILDMAAGTGMRVVAEGIETEAQAAALRRLDCETAQGYFFAEPALPSQAVAVLGCDRIPHEQSGAVSIPAAQSGTEVGLSAADTAE